jgi:hypothetical protein
MAEKSSSPASGTHKSDHHLLQHNLAIKQKSVAQKIDVTIPSPNMGHGTVGNKNNQPIACQYTRESDAFQDQI